jgi:hypothetical protein
MGPNLVKDNGYIKGDKNPKHEFLQRASKAISPMS